MRDAFGGAFMIKLFLVFIFIYICFTALALNYAKAFKVKNKVIDYLETNEIKNLDSLTANELNQMNLYFEEEVLGNMNYNMGEYNICQGYPKKDDAGRTIAICHDAGIIIRESGKASNTEGIYYTVSTYLGWSIGFLNKLTALNGNNKKPDEVTGTWKISGQTRLIVQE